MFQLKQAYRKKRGQISSSSAFCSVQAPGGLLIPTHMGEGYLLSPLTEMLVSS